MGISYTRTEEEIENSAEHRVTDVPVQPGHRSRMDVVHTVADHEVGPGLQRLEKARDLLEVIGQVGVGHHHVAPLGGAEACQVGAAIPSAWLVGDVRAGARGDLGAAVVGAVVGHHDLAGDARLVHGTTCPHDALLDRPGLVQAGDDYRDQRPALGGPAGDGRPLRSLDRAH
jgi:hypothetical protein